MKLSVLLCCSLLLAVAAGELANWESHGEIIDLERLNKPAIDENLIRELQSSNDLAAATWTSGLNERFEGMNLADAKVLLGVLQDKFGKSSLPPRAYTQEEIKNVPQEFDWRTDARGKDCPSLREIRDQANCGSCWAFGSVEAMTDRRCIASKGEKKEHLSAQDVTSCCGLLHGDMGCNGGIPSSVYGYYASNGIVTGGNYNDTSMCYSYQLAPCAHHVNSTKFPPCPQEVPTPKCAKSCVDDHASWSSSKRFGTAGYSVCKQSGGNGTCAQQMAAEIFANGPITGMFFVHQDFLAYKSGVYAHTKNSPMLGGHAIKIMGFGTENGTPYWLVANSWNNLWGDHGYFKIKRGTNECQIEDAIINGGPVAGMPKL